MKVYAIIVDQNNNGGYEDYWHNEELFRITMSKETAIRCASSMTRYPDIVTGGTYGDINHLARWELIESDDNCFYYKRTPSDPRSLDAQDMRVTIKEKYVFK